jgi:2-dehydro-3-deoxyphosphooctonate aldolase (KDO 8-P synthase)
MKKIKIIAGNCVVENCEVSYKTAKFLNDLSKEMNFDLVYKSSFKKDNRSSVEFFNGLGLDECCKIFKQLKKDFNFEILTDFHNLYELDHEIINTIDVIQVPAYLCMQTELTLKMGLTNKKINIKKGQFLSPEDTLKIVKKIESTGNKSISITERGACFGYRDLVVDPRSFVVLKKSGYPVIFDAGHSVRKYGVPSSNIKDGGSKEFILTLARSAIVSYVDGIFVEVHPNPSNAKCDAATQLSFSEFTALIKDLIPLWNFVNN